MNFSISKKQVIKLSLCFIISFSSIIIIYHVSDKNSIKLCLTSGNIDNCILLGKTFLEWIDVSSKIALPILLFFLTRWFQEKEQERIKAEKQREQERMKAEKQREQNNLKEQAFQEYIDRMSQILLDTDKRLEIIEKDNFKEDSFVKDVARTLTTTILRRLEGDTERQDRVIYFLKDTELLFHLLKTCNLSKTDIRGANLIGVDLSKTNLRGVNLSKAHLFKANLEEARLSKAHLFKANLEEARLEKAYLFEANIRGADLSKASLEGANLRGADLRESTLRRANLREDNLRGAILEGANLSKANLSKADIRGADLSKVSLEGANLREANLGGANLRGTNLKEAILEGANLRGTNLKEAENWQKAKYDPEFRKKLGLPPDTSELE